MNITSLIGVLLALVFWCQGVDSSLAFSSVKDELGLLSPSVAEQVERQREATEAVTGCVGVEVLSVLPENLPRETLIQRQSHLCSYLLLVVNEPDPDNAGHALLRFAYHAPGTSPELVESIQNKVVSAYHDNGSLTEALTEFSRAYQQQHVGAFWENALKYICVGVAVLLLPAMFVRGAMVSLREAAVTISARLRQVGWRFRMPGREEKREQDYRY